jgi:hypothetical protein
MLSEAEMRLGDFVALGLQTLRRSVHNFINRVRRRSSALQLFLAQANENPSVIASEWQGMLDEVGNEMRNAWLPSDRLWRPQGWKRWTKATGVWLFAALTVLSGLSGTGSSGNAIWMLAVLAGSLTVAIAIALRLKRDWTQDLRAGNQGPMLFALLVMLTIGSSLPAWTQTEPNLANGIIPYGSYDEHGIGAVGLMNGNLFSHIPFPQDYIQRGKGLHNVPFLVMNGKTWTETEAPGGQWYWTPSVPWQPASVSSQETVFPYVITRVYETDVDPDGNVSTSAYNYGLTTWDGNQFGGSIEPGITADTGWQLTNLGNPDSYGTPMSGILIDRDGNQFPFTFSGGWGLPDNSQ